MYFEKKIYKLLTEEDVMDKMITYKDEEGNEKEATVGGILKKGKDHPAHDDAQAAVNKSKGKEKSEPKVAKIDANPFDKADDQADDMKSDDAQSAKDKEDIKDALEGAVEGIYDALSRDMDYDDQDVSRMIDNDLQAAFQAGADDDDIINFAKKFDPDVRQMLQKSLDNLAVDIDVTDGGSSANLRPSDPDYKSPGERDTKGSDNPYDKGDEYDAGASKPNYDDDDYAKKTDDTQEKVAKKYGLSAMQLYDNAGKEPEDFESWDQYENHLNKVAKKLKDLGYSDPYADEESDSDDTDYDSDYYSDVEDVDPDEGISDAVKGIRPEMRERAFEMIIQGFDDDYDLKEMYKNLKNGKMPNPKEDSFGAIQHLILKQGIEEGSIDYGSDGMELANYLETREEDLYDQMMDPDQYDEIQEVKKLFKKRAGI